MVVVNRESRPIWLLDMSRSNSSRKAFCESMGRWNLVYARWLCSCGDAVHQDEGGSVGLYVSVDTESLKPKRPLIQITLRASRPNSQGAVTQSGVVCETKDGVSEQEESDWWVGPCGAEEYYIRPYLRATNKHLTPIDSTSGSAYQITTDTRDCVHVSS
jgi:hypothetical protein